MKSSTLIKRTMAWATSPQALATLKVAIAAVALFQAIEELRKSNTRIGFRGRR